MKTRRLDLSGATLWLARVEEVEPEEWPALYARMDPARRARCDRLRREEDRHRCILADALARRALSAETGLAEEAVVWRPAPGGKPYAVGLDKHFSLSHSASLVLCAVADRPVGADIQRRRPVSSAMLRRVARAGYAGENDEDFFAWWVRQEAAGKLDGRGLTLAPLPQGLAFRSGVLDEPDGRYFYCVCGEKGLFSPA